MLLEINPCINAERIRHVRVAVRKWSTFRLAASLFLRTHRIKSQRRTRNQLELSGIPAPPICLSLLLILVSFPSAHPDRTCSDHEKKNANLARCGNRTALFSEKWIHFCELPDRGSCSFLRNVKRVGSGCAVEFAVERRRSLRDGCSRLYIAVAPR